LVFLWTIKNNLVPRKSRGTQAEEVKGWALRELEGILRAATCRGHAQNDRGRTREGGLIPQLGYELRDQCDRDIPVRPIQQGKPASRANA
jgi:hypothetical protein